MNTLLRMMFLSLSVILISCTNDSTNDSNPFGALYRIMQSTHPPAIASDSLIVTVSYSGCNRNHIFALRYFLRGPDDAEIWLSKLTPDQVCDMYIEETKEMHLPGVVAGRSTIILITPQKERIVLRTGNP
jgi:hypothetical protein